MKKCLSFAMLSATLLALPNVSFAGKVISNTQITLYAISTSSGSDGSLIQLKTPGTLSKNCDGSRAYILAADKELFSTALSVDLAKKSVNVMVEENAAPKHFPGHISNLTCQVISIWSN